MASANINKILQDSDSLTEDERRELLRLLASRSQAESSLSKEDRLQRQLVAEGLVSHVPPKKKDADRFRQWRPVEIEGKPLSQTIAEERR